MSGPAISAREAAVLALLGEHLSNAEIGARLSISVPTVESHISSLLRKLRLPDRRALSRHVREHHLRGEGWFAHRTPDGCTLRWLTNHPTAHYVSAEATAAITDADFERLRQDPGSAHDLILKYEPVSVIE